MKLRIGTRGSQLALTQTKSIADRLSAAHKGLEVEILTIVTTGDKQATGVLSGKGVFVKEIEEALLRKEIDLAVHSLKDVPQTLPEGLVLGSFPEREDVRDAFVSRFGEQLNELPKKSTIGTSSPRRKAQVLFRHKKRGYNVVPFRGNVETRLKKIQAGEVDAALLAVAGLKRIGLGDEISQILEPEEILPAPGQGCLGLEHRESDAVIRDLLMAIRHPQSEMTAKAERAFLQALGGDCNLPVGAYAKIAGDKVIMKAVALDVEGTTCVEATHEGPISMPDYVGMQLAERLLINGGSELLIGPLPSAQ